MWLKFSFPLAFQHNAAVDVKPSFPQSSVMADMETINSLKINKLEEISGRSVRCVILRKASLST